MNGHSGVQSPMYLDLVPTIAPQNDGRPLAQLEPAPSEPGRDGWLARPADVRRQTELLLRLETERRATENRVEQRVRSAMHEMGASWAAIGLAREAAEAARNNFDLVRDSYARGVVSILDLLDAQNQALVAELVAANEVYRFVIDLMEVQRAAGRYDFFATSEERDDFFDRLEAFVADAER